MTTAKDGIGELCSIDGLGNIFLGGALGGAKPFMSAYDNGVTQIPVKVELLDSNYAVIAWERVRCTYVNPGNQLVRGAVMESSNGGALVNFGAGTKRAFVYLPVADTATAAALTSGLATKAETVHTQAASTISDSTVAGRALLTAADAAAQRTAMGLGSLATQSATLSGTNTGDQTSIVGIAGAKAQFNAAVTDGDILYVGDAPSAHTQALSTLTQSGATTSQVPAWNGTAWVPAPALGNDPAFFWDTTNKRLGIGTAIPEVSLAVNGDINAGGNIVARSASSGFGQSADGEFRATNEPLSNYLAFSKDAGITLNAQGRNFGAVGSILTVQSSVALTVGNILRIKNGTTDMFAIDFNGKVNASGGVESAMLRLTPEPVGTLPTPTAGRIKVVNDATSTTPRSIAAGGGSNVCLVLANGTNWLIV